jgi:hypothetical protein
MIRPWISFGFACIALVAALGSANAQPKKPKLPPGLDPGGPAIVLLTTGVDYTYPAVASRLARDGEGDLIGLDTIDGGNRPYAAGGNGTGLALALLSAPGIRIIPVRIDPDHPPSLIAAVKFAARSPGRIVVMPQLPRDAGQRAQLLAGLAQFPDRLFIVPAQSDDAATPGASNILAVAPAGAASPAADVLVVQDPPSSPMAVAEFTAALLSCAATETSALETAIPKLKTLAALLSPSGAKPDSIQPCRISAPSR